MGSIIIISLALALGTYGIAAQRGANLVKLDRYILLMSALWGIMELAAAFAGYGAGRWILTREVVTEHNLYWVHVLAGVLMAAVGLRMLLQAFFLSTEWSVSISGRMSCCHCGFVCRLCSSESPADCSCSR